MRQKKPGPSTRQVKSRLKTSAARVRKLGEKDRIASEKKKALRKPLSWNLRDLMRNAEGKPSSLISATFLPSSTGYFEGGNFIVTRRTLASQVFDRPFTQIKAEYVYDSRGRFLRRHPYLRRSMVQRMRNAKGKEIKLCENWAGRTEGTGFLARRTVRRGRGALFIEYEFDSRGKQVSGGEK